MPATKDTRFKSEDRFLQNQNRIEFVTNKPTKSQKQKQKETRILYECI